MLKKYLSIFIIILAVVFVTLSLLGIKSEYRTEKSLYKANLMLDKVLRDPASIPPGMYKKLISNYTNIIKRFPKSKITPRARLLLGQAYILKGDYAEAREELKSIIKDYPGDRELCAQSQFIIGNAYEKQNNWPEALAQYEKLIRDYGSTVQGLNTPLYIALYYKNKGQTPQADEAFKRAVQYYQDVAFNNQKTALGYAALNNIFSVYMDQKNMSEAADALANLMINYPMHSEIGRTLQAFNVICFMQLKEPKRVANFYENFIEKYPKHPLASAMEKQIKKIKEKESTKEK